MKGKNRTNVAGRRGRWYFGDMGGDAVRASIDRELLRLAATRAMLKLCLPPENREPGALSQRDEQVARALIETSDFHLTCEIVALPAGDVLESIRRILW